MTEPTLEPEYDDAWRRVRADFPVTESIAYFNSAGAGPVPRAVADAAAGFYRETMESGDRAWTRWLERREQARARVAAFINADPDEIAFTTNTSSGMNLIVDALEGRGPVVSCELEFPVSTIPWMHRGVRVNLLKAVAGELRTEDVLGAAKDGAGVICLSHVQYSNGFRTDIEEIGRNKGRSVYVVNASQSAGVLPIDVKRMKIDALCATGHKWMLAGYGSGFVYLSRALLAETRPRAVSWMSVHDPFRMRNDAYDLRDDAAARAETGCPHFAGIFALGAAVEYLQSIGVERIERRALDINRRTTERLARAGWRILSPLAREGARSPETLVAAPQPYRVYKMLAERNVAVTIKPEGIRVATHFFNDDSDIERLLAALEDVRRRLKGDSQAS
ncbi:MAG TPA: aminotransferase class V-fold PLP-dependent enzyme [Pyrinomonadaceae bacterium]|nr:aminotransferase class V-fold PLP-dependent enzyme [Pyrinomonadaceae bacterium]